jgi:hypothetical protein
MWQLATNSDGTYSAQAPPCTTHNAIFLALSLPISQTTVATAVKKILYSYYEITI